jgi:DNA-binding NarL/FixJ family response regulator
MSSNEGPITIVLATDSFLFGDGLACMLAHEDDVDVVGRARDHLELVQMVDELDPSAAIISIRSPVASTLAMLTAARHLRDHHPDLGIVVISDRGNGFALELLSEGASHMAYLLDERLAGMEAVLGALREVMAGQSVLDPSIVDALVHRRNVTTIDDLTPREIDVLELMARGLSNRGIAGELALSIKGIEKHVTTIFRKLALTDQSFIDRRVTAALTFLRSQDHQYLVTEADPEPPRLIDAPRTRSGDTQAI